MITSKEFVTDENTGQSEDSEGIVASTPAKKVAKKTASKKVVAEPAPNFSDDPIANINQEEVMVFMKSGHSYHGPEVNFTKEDPFQLMNPIEAGRLINSMSYRFEYASKQQVEKFYSLG